MTSQPSVTEAIGAMPVLGWPFSLPWWSLGLFLCVVDFGLVVASTALEGTLRVPGYWSLWGGDGFIIPLYGLVMGWTLHQPGVGRVPLWLQGGFLALGVAFAWVSEGMHVVWTAQNFSRVGWAGLPYHKLWHAFIAVLMVYWILTALVAGWTSVKTPGVWAALAAGTALLSFHLVLMAAAPWQATHQDVTGWVITKTRPDGGRIVP